MSKDRQNSDPFATSTEWMTKLTEFWSPVMETWAAGVQPTHASSESPPEKMSASLNGFVQMWQEMIKGAGDPLGMEHLQESSQAVPDMMMVFAQSCLRGFTRFQEQVNLWMENKEGAFTMEDTQSFQNLFLQGWTDAYEKEFRQFLKMPQIGLGRVYQERVLKAADKHNLFQAAFTKFIYLLYLPMEEAFDQLQQQVAEHAKNEQLEEDPKAYYQLWVKLLEASYMKLFKQREFSVNLGQTLKALNDYSVAKQAVVNDILKQNAIPTHDDLDELYKEIYLIKKRMRLYEKR